MDVKCMVSLSLSFIGSTCVDFAFYLNQPIYLLGSLDLKDISYRPLRPMCITYKMNILLLSFNCTRCLCYFLIYILFCWTIMFVLLVKIFLVELIVDDLKLFGYIYLFTCESTRFAEKNLLDTLWREDFRLTESSHNVWAMEQLCLLEEYWT